jgi:hypothetical protein
MVSAAEELTNSIGNKQWISEWKRMEESASVKRGKELMIYNVSHTQGRIQPLLYTLLTPIQWTAPSQATKQQNLATATKQGRSVQWLSEGLNLEAEQ